MAKTNVWQDEYWLPVLQLYLQRPVGVKPLYQRDAVQLCMELHVAPKTLHERQTQIAQLSTPRLERIWQTYSENPRRLARAVRLWREMRGFGAASEFYEGVEVQETFEKDFRPLAEDGRLTPVALILVLDLYFQLVPQTMVAQTPEVAELARLLGVSPGLVEEVLHLYQLCDPYLNRQEVTFSALLLPCQQVWQRFANGDTGQLNALAGELKEYYR
ncbi:MAG: hypothetical protein IJ841_05225 [Prevotella sp.]|nr:hypothetical protein [Prevotella sp.]